MLLVGHENPLTAANCQREDREDEEDLIDHEDEEYSSEVQVEDEQERDYNHNNRYVTVTTTAPNQLIYSSSLYYRQSCHKWKKIRALFFADRCIMLDSNVSIRRFVEALQTNDQPQLDRMKHKTISFAQIARVSFSQNQQRYRNEFVVVYSRRPNSAAAAAADESMFREQAVLKLKCTSREEMLWWSRLFETYVRRRR